MAFLNKLFDSEDKCADEVIDYSVVQILDAFALFENNNNVCVNENDE